VLDGAEMVEAKLARTSLIGADLSDANLNNAVMVDAKLKGTSLGVATCVRLHLRGIDPTDYSDWELKGALVDETEGGQEAQARCGRTQVEDMSRAS
jgi:uncharacterized protein YjbI with pentapeptide repeats